MGWAGVLTTPDPRPVIQWKSPMQTFSPSPAGSHDEQWRRSPEAIASADEWHVGQVADALESACQAIEGLLTWGGRRADPDGRLSELVELIDRIRPGLQVAESDG